MPDSVKNTRHNIKLALGFGFRHNRKSFTATASRLVITAALGFDSDRFGSEADGAAPLASGNDF
ncbi:MAG: hypothetical protein MZV49_20425 [Rhodopseudomonas palustris]|nr:hypothetical protein [Rhodopseudomonas palustris]